MQEGKPQRTQYVLTVMIFASFAWAGIFHSWQETLAVSENMAARPLINAAGMVHAKNSKQKSGVTRVNGLYLTAYSANSPKKRASIIDLIKKTELNGVVIDIKDYSGKILYDSNVGLVNELGTEEWRVKDMKAVIKEFQDNGIYVIARQTVFQDPILAEKKPAWAIKHKDGGLWRDYKGLAWVDPTQKEVWDYNRAIAKEAIALGFDEINFDYVRFPSDGPVRDAVYANLGDRKKHENMREFFAYISQTLSHEPAWLSLDLFGFVMERHDGMTIGQRLEDAVDVVDIIAPMMYPSHYPSGHLGLENPADHPGQVLENGMKKGAPYFENTRASARPWIQAFNLGAVYDAQKMRAQIDAVEAYTDAGWLLWNASNRYSAAGLKAAE